jgi:hypothetical protein
MYNRGRALFLGGVVFAALTTAACSGFSSSDGQVAAADSNSPSAVPEPTQVVTDAPITIGPATDTSIFLTRSEWDADAAAVYVSGYLEGVVEDDGQCTLTLTKDGQSVSATKPGTSNVTNTSCGQLTVAGSELSTGVWTATVSYSSSTSSGSSEPVQVEVP